jgi:hypothetical protein
LRGKVEKHLFVQGNLTWIINWDFILVVKTIQRALRLVGSIGSYYFFTGYDFIMGSHCHFVPENIYVPLHKWNWLGQNIKASSN